ncbi:sigma factor-like helix-turn-helix DNA-binding protein [uncultured Nostoc sp.]|uniref:sigma factor-like helix-turn-helix DNA-binding protein n=1 Tax=uncultured Nostoc sp. TaxID=340711 RepID=UPI0035CA13D7
MNSLLESLKLTQHEVLILRFGLENDQELTLAQIGEKLNVSRERVRQIQQQAITVLRPHLRLCPVRFQTCEKCGLGS